VPIDYNVDSKWSTLGQVDISCGIFQGDSLSPLLFVMSLAPLSVILDGTYKGYEFSGTSTIIINHLVYMDDIKLYSHSKHEIESLIHTVNIFFDDIRMSLGVAKCNIVAVSRGHLVDSDSVSLSCGDLIHYLSPVGVYKYLGILESDSFKQHQMKTLLTKEYKRRVQKFLRTNLYSKYLITAINTCAVSIEIFWGNTRLVPNRAV